MRPQFTRTRFALLLATLAAVAVPASAAEWLYTTDALPTASGWSVYNSASAENGNGITSTITQDTGSTVWKLVDGSATFRCKEKNGSLGNLGFSVGCTVAARVKCESSTNSSYNIGISNGNVGGMALAIKTNQLILMEMTGTVRRTYNVSGTDFHIYYLTVKNSGSGNNTATWRVYRDGVEITSLSYVGVGDDESYDGFFAGHDGASGTGTWYFDWIAARSDGAYSPAEWQPMPSQLPTAPALTSPAGDTLALTPIIRWTGDLHDAYEIHINTTNTATDAGVWDSGTVSSTASYSSTPVLPNGALYAFVRLRNPLGWGPWSTGRPFIVDARARIIPEPQELAWKPQAGFQVSDQTVIVTNASPDAKDTFTAEQLRRKVWETTGHLPSIVPGGAGAPTNNVIAIGGTATNQAVSSIIATWPDAAGKASKSEGYLLGVKDASIVIRGFDQAGTFYGCQSLIQLLEHYGNSPIDSLFCYDYPTLPWRGMYVRVRYKYDIEFTKEIVSEIAARLKLNRLEFDMSFGTIWNSHPELYQGDPAMASRPQDLLPIIECARQHFIEPIPSGNLLSHTSEWTTAGTLNSTLRENRAAAENSGLETICHRNPDGMRLVHDLWDEMIELYNHPTYLHIGWDEISAIGDPSCPYCWMDDPVTLFNEFLWSDWNYLNARSVRPIMWGDMLRGDQNGGGDWNLKNVVPSMPDGIIVQDWEYAADKDYPSLDTWTANGMNSIGAPYGIYNPGIENIYWWGKSAADHGVWGIVAFNKFQPQYREGLLNASAQLNELSMYESVAEWSWSPERPYFAPAPYDAVADVRYRLAPDYPYSFTALPSGGPVVLQWTNPPESKHQATWIVFRTDRLPTDPLDGTPVADVPGASNAVVSYTHTTAPRGTAVYYAAFSHDAVRHFSPESTATVTNGTPVSAADLSSIPDGTIVKAAGLVVTAAYQGRFYAGNVDRTAGIRVESTAGVSLGDIVTVFGALGKTGPERSLTALTVTVTGQQNPAIRSMAMRNSAVGGADKGFVPGCGVAGLNNVGILVTAFGQPLNPDPEGRFFYISDGSSAGGIKVLLTGGKTAMSLPPGEYLAIRGISCLDSDGSAMLWPRSQADIIRLK